MAVPMEKGRPREVGAARLLAPPTAKATGLVVPSIFLPPRAVGRDDAVIRIGRIGGLW